MLSNAMSTSFFEKLESRARAADSLLCVGLDPRAANANDARDQCLRLIDATHEFAAAFKANSAFFEVFGAEGITALCDVIQHVPRDIPLILDAKRGDIPDTSAAYARAGFDTLGASAITVNPYLGGDAIAPFVENAEHGAFVLCKTSNPGADEFQALEFGDTPLFEIIAQHAQTWNTRNNVGLVIGATDPARLARVRELVPTMWFLVPGIGAQGGDLKATLRAGLRADGMGLLINVSRPLASATDPRTAAKQLRAEINTRRTTSIAPPSAYPDVSSRTLSIPRVMRDDTSPLPNPLAASPQIENQLARDLLASGGVRFGEFTLKSGQKSPIYLDLRRLVSHPTILKRVAHAYAELLRSLTFDRIAGIPYAALPIATATSLELNKPLIYPRREVKEYGTRAAIEGEYEAGETIVVLDDLATTGDTKIETIEKLKSVGLNVRDIVVLIDRGQSAGEMLARAGYQLHAVTTLPQLLQVWHTSNAITSEQYNAVNEFLRGA